MFKDGDIIPFESVDHFNDMLSHMKEDAYQEFVKLSTYFSKVIKENGPDTFRTTLVVFNKTNKLVGVITCKPVDGKDQMYRALAQMLFLPASIDSQLFILAQDARVTKFNQKDPTIEPQKTDALVLTYVTQSNCAVFTVPYTINEDNVVTFDYDSSYFNTIASSDGTTSSVARGDMIELMFIFSHMDSNGPFSYHEVLHFFKTNGFEYQIIDPSALEEKRVGIPVMVSSLLV